MASSGQIEIPGQKKSPPWVKKLIWILVIGLFLFLTAAGALVYFILYQISRSQPARMSVQFVRQSTEVREQLGNIQETGWPLGSLSVEAGGSGEASFSFKIKGSLGEGKAYTTLVRTHGQWQMVSGRLQVKEGPSVRLIPGDGSGDEP